MGGWVNRKKARQAWPWLIGETNAPDDTTHIPPPPTPTPPPHPKSNPNPFHTHTKEDAFQHPLCPPRHVHGRTGKVTGNAGVHGPWVQRVHHHGQLLGLEALVEFLHEEQEGQFA